MKLYSSVLELAAIRSLTSGDDRVVSLMLPRLSQESFSLEHTGEAFMRAMTLLQRHGDMPRWGDLLADMAISEDAREELAHRRVDPVRNRREADDLLKRLDEYRRARLLMRAANLTASRLQADSVDLDALTDELTDAISGARGTVDMNDHTTTIGGAKNDRAILREALTETEDEFVPTGIQAFDRESQGVPRGASWVIAATTGGGKCLRFSEEILTSEGTVAIGELWNSVDTPVDKHGFKSLDRPVDVLTHAGKRKRISKVYKTRGRMMRVTFSNGATVTGLPEHRIWILDASDRPQFRRLDSILVGDRTIIHDVEQSRAALIMLQTASVTSIEYFDEEEDAYDLTVEDDHSYMMANGIMSHNSAIALQVAIHQAGIGAKVLIVSLEMTRKIIIRRLLSNLSGIPLSRINRAHTLDEDTRRLLIRTWNEFHEKVRKNGGRLRIVSPPEDISMDEILAMYRPHGYDNKIVDYLGLTKGMDTEDQWRKMGSAVRTCTRCASADNNIITLLCQLTADGMIRYSRTILEHAHLAWTWTYVDEAVRESRIITIKQPKTRNLKSFDFHVVESFSNMRVTALEPGREPPKRGDKKDRDGKARIGHNGGPPLDDNRPRRAFTQNAFTL